MATTEVKYLGLDLKSPVVVSSCSLTADVDKVKEMQRAGAGAVVMKSLFEEQIRGEVEFMASAGHSYPEMDDYLHAYIRSNSIAPSCLHPFQFHSSVHGEGEGAEAGRDDPCHSQYQLL